MSDSEQQQGARKALSKRLRFDIFKRDSFKCQYCGAHPPQAVLEVDHINPVVAGGRNDADNLVTACAACNRGKGAALLSDVPQSLEDRAAATLEREAQIAGYEAVMRGKRQRLEDEAMEVFGAFANYFSAEDYISEADFQSIKRFVDKLGLHTVLEAAGRAMGKNPHWYSQAFKYFCGICWSKIREGDFR